MKKTDYQNYSSLVLQTNTPITTNGLYKQVYGILVLVVKRQDDSMAPCGQLLDESGSGDCRNS